MATMIFTRDSTKKVLGVCRRHKRRCNRVKGAGKYSDLIDPSYENLIEKRLQLEEARENSIDIKDDIFMETTEINNTIRTVFEDCIQYDRNHPDTTVINIIFPSGTYFNSFISLKLDKKILKVEQLIYKFKTLGDKHPLFKSAALLGNRLNKLNKSRKMFQEAMHAEKLAEVDEQMAKADLCKAYEANYLDARQAFVRDFAESLFPKIAKKYYSLKEEEDEQDADEVNNAA